ncbi:clostripain-related cysteine peptidase [Sphingobacterium faecium]|uniref:clostripain-related cysteine peptidase n=1 Tax=Sphingobacterium faecium TaxID=34087 RepID=UPI00247B08AA|nr:clostripain-related cysteine peptidase [Sphingobacterium faecium]WGQ13765.1 clostripain-related cysteine peptidase [Sphingobacterium faecium]
MILNKYKKRYLITFLCVGILQIFASCKKDDKLPKINSDITTIIYMEANNNLRGEARKAIHELEEGLLNTKAKSNILVYIKDNDDIGYLLQIVANADPYRIVSDTIMSFPFYRKSDANQIREVLTYVDKRYNSETYNLVLWSHGTAWSPGADYLSPPKSKSFGEDRGQQIDIIALKDALPMHFNFIVFDACSMASIEVLYEFRDKADFIIASPTDILSDGFPYKAFVSALSYPDRNSLIRIANSFFNYYDIQQGLYRSASVSVTDLSKLSKLASYLKLKSDHDRVYVTDGVQRLDFTPGFPVKLYDFSDFITKNFKQEDADAIRKLMDEAILYKNNTKEFLGNKIYKFSGITISCPLPDDPFYTYYSELSWNKDSFFLK